MMESRNKLVLLVLVAFTAASVFIYKSIGKEVESIENAVNPSNNPFKGSDQFVSGEYRDGLYTASGGYVSPGGPEEVEVSIKLRNDIIEEIELVKGAERPTSIFFQGKFESGYKELVLGKNINEVALDKVAGSSLTPKGFNEALERIKAQAKS